MRPGPDSFTLGLLREPSLVPRDAGYGLHAYRFLWARTFHERRLFRITVEPDNSGSVLRKAYWPAVTGGDLSLQWVEDVAFACSAEDVATWMRSVETARLWELAPEDPTRSGFDGSNWTIEALKYGRYHILHRWSPDEAAILELATAFFKVARYEPEESTFY